MQSKFVSNTSSASPGLFRKLLGIIATAAIVVLAIMFSAVLLVVLLVLGSIAGAFVWWNTRELRKQMRDFSPQGVAQEEKASNDEVFEGEVIRVVESQDGR